MSTKSTAKWGRDTRLQAINGNTAPPTGEQNVNTNNVPKRW